MTGDKERLDWLEHEIMSVDKETLSSICREITFFFEQNYYRIADEHDSIGKGVTLRDAIDSARAAMKEGAR